MNHCFQRLAAPVRNRQGVAFPIALLGILGVSVTVTAVLLTATTENALSFAHKDATRALYVSQGAVEAYVAEKGMQLTAIENFSYLRVGGPETDRTRITVRQVGSAVPSAPNAQLNWPRDLLFAVEAQPINGGRTVGALARVMSVVMKLKNDVDAAVISAKDVTINGAKTNISDGSDSPYCTEDPAGNALQIKEGAKVDTGQATITGKVSTLDQSDSYDYVYDMLGTSFKNLIANANIKIDQATVEGNNTITSFGSTADPTNAQATPRNWGCPWDLMKDQNKNCSNDGATADAQAADAVKDSVHFPIIAINAMNTNGTWGTVKLNLDHGQGLLIVYNGDLSIAGNLSFKGLIIVEGNFTVNASGGGANTPKIEGSIIGLGKGDGISKIDEDMDIVGAPTIRYNACAINSVIKAIQETNAFDRETPRTSSWYEMVR